MTRGLIISFAILVLSGLFTPTNSLSSDYLKREYSTRLSPGDYLLKSFDEHGSSIFDSEYQVIDLGVDLALGSDCGRIDFQGTMQAALKNVLDAKYFGNLGQNIVAASPMLLTCYFSPTWCAILKHFRVNANYLSQMRLDQCALIDQYVDSRTEDYYRERQQCVRQQIDLNGGNLEAALQSCQNIYDVDLASWAGGGQKSDANKLIESSVKWAGFSGEDANRSMDLVKAFVGDTVVSRGNVSVDYGPRRKALTPQSHLRDQQKWVHDKLCDGIMKRIEDQGFGQNPDRLVRESDLNEINIYAEMPIIDRQTIEALAYMPIGQRRLACKKLSDAMGLTVFTNDANRSLDLLTVSAQNPNLPPNRKEEIETKRKLLKDSIEVTLDLQQRRNDPLRYVMAEINQAGSEHRDHATRRVFSADEGESRRRHARSMLLDCADGIMCERR